MRIPVFFRLTTAQAIAFTLALALLFCSSQAESRAAANRVKMGLHVSGMGNLDPHLAAGSQDRAFADMVFNGLLRYVPGEAPLVEPDLALAMPQFEMKEGRQVWTISLRKGVMFHPAPGLASYELTADDVVFSLAKSADSKFSAYAGDYSSWNVSKLDNYTIQISLSTPVSPVLFLPKLTNYAGGFIVSKKAIEAMGHNGFKDHPVGTGPFRFSSYQKGGVMQLVPHENYFRGKPKLSGVELHFYPDMKEREKRFLSGELNVILGSGEDEWIEKFEKLEGTTLDTFGVGEVSTIFFNTAQAPFEDVRIRKAVFLALDRAGFLETTSQRLAGAVFSPVPEMFLPGGLTEEEVKKLDLLPGVDREKARLLLAEAGYPDGISLDLVASEKRLYKGLYNVLKEQLAKIGINCSIKEVKHSEMHKIIRKEEKPLVIYGAWRPNADAYLTRFFHSDSIVITGRKPDTNFSRYSAIDNLIENARLEIRPEKQIELWQQAQIRILSDAVAYPILYTRQLYARKSSVKYGHPLKSTMALYPQITENTTVAFD